MLQISVTIHNELFLIINESKSSLILSMSTNEKNNIHFNLLYVLFIIFRLILLIYRVKKCIN